MWKFVIDNWKEILSVIVIISGAGAVAYVVRIRFPELLSNMKDLAVDFKALTNSAVLKADCEKNLDKTYKRFEQMLSAVQSLEERKADGSKIDELDRKTDLIVADLKEGLEGCAEALDAKCKNYREACIHALEGSMKSILKELSDMRKTLDKANEKIDRQAQQQGRIDERVKILFEGWVKKNGNGGTQ